MPQLVVSKNNLFFWFLIFGYLFGVIFYDYLKFDYTDELMAFFLVLFAGAMVWERRDMKQLRPLIWVGVVFLFYTVYSFAIRANVPQAIIKDMIIQLKPFLGFFCAYLIAPRLTQQQRLLASMLCLLVGGLIVVVFMTNNMWTFFGHPSRLATSATVTAMLFLYCSSFTWNDVMIFILLLSTGLLSTRSKFYGFWGLTIFLVIYIKAGGQVKFSLNTILLFAAVAGVAVFLSWEKIVLYYIKGAMNSREMWSRPAMMVTAVLILGDYFPFGCGFGSFGTFASGEYYSKIYAEYGIDKFWGLSKEKPDFITDAFYPELAQFGIVGVVLYFAFWVWIVRKGWPFQQINPKLFTLILLIFIFFLIEGIADATFTHNRGLFILILLGCVLSESSDKVAAPEKEKELSDN